MAPITLFSWGYWGWGNATSQLLKAVDAVEEARGFRPPLFVDIRISRSVRAAGFRDNSFEQLAGPGRYTWMRTLGNRHIETRTGPRIQIAEPAAAAELLDLASDAADMSRRLLFFCSCEYPINEHGEECHRVEVARLVRANARKRGIPIQTVEWPGGQPSKIDLEVSRDVLRNVQRGRASVPLGKPVQLDRVAGLAWGTSLRLRAGEDTVTLITGPVRYQGGGWSLPVLQPGFRRSRGYEPV